MLIDVSEQLKVSGCTDYGAPQLCKGLSGLPPYLSTGRADMSCASYLEVPDAPDRHVIAVGGRDANGTWLNSTERMDSSSPNSPWGIAEHRKT